MATTPYTIGEQWEFRQDASTRRWHWRRRSREGDVVSESTRAFPSLQSAIEDAMRNGFTYTVRSKSA